MITLTDEKGNKYVLKDILYIPDVDQLLLFSKLQQCTMPRFTYLNDSGEFAFSTRNSLNDYVVNDLHYMSKASLKAQDLIANTRSSQKRNLAENNFDHISDSPNEAFNSSNDDNPDSAESAK